ncbi:MAG: hypothetical protein OSB63_04235 [Planctomycetota bacterium]|nr:hypothetical protein [Planctomycetota bacterium]
MAVQKDDLPNVSLVNTTLATTFIIIALSYISSGLYKRRVLDLEGARNVQSIVAERVELRQQQIDGVAVKVVTDKLAESKQQVIDSYNN